MTIKTIPLKLRSKSYEIRFSKTEEGKLVWKAYWFNEFFWEKVPMWTDAEERAFPKTVAKIAHENWLKLSACAS